MQKQAKITSKGQITVPRDVRRALGLRAGDRLVFESVGQEVRVRAVRPRAHFPSIAASAIPELAPVGRTSASGCADCVGNDNRD